MTDDTTGTWLETETVSQKAIRLSKELKESRTAAIADLLKQIAEAKAALKELGYKQLRPRVPKAAAAPSDVPKAASKKK